MDLGAKIMTSVLTDCLKALRGAQAALCEHCETGGHTNPLDHQDECYAAMEAIEEAEKVIKWLS
jgi:hypothetical protein